MQALGFKSMIPMFQRPKTTCALVHAGTGIQFHNPNVSAAKNHMLLRPCNHRDSSPWSQ